MSLRNQPYFPLYVQDYLTDEKLNECSAQSQGVYIKLMCLMHKSETYGKILLKQKDKQNDNQIKNFAAKLVRHLPFSVEIIFNSLDELLSENVLFIEVDFICQKRMIKDNEISIKRSKSGKKGGEKTQKEIKLALAKNEASSEYEYEDDNEINLVLNGVKKEIADFFGFNEVSHFQNITQINSFVNLLQDKTHFEQQFKDYKEFISIRGKQYQLGFKNYIGTPSEQFKDGQWNSENWSEKLDAEKNKKIKKSKTLQHDSDFATN